MRETYYKIGKTNNYFVVFKINEFRGKKFYKEYYYSTKFSDTIHFCKSRNYNLRGLLI